MKIDKFGLCPECGKSWDRGRIKDIWRKLPNYDKYSDEKLEEMEKSSYSEPYHFSHLVGIEVRGKYDGVSYYQCPFCKATWDRFTGEKVEDGI